MANIIDIREKTTILLERYADIEVQDIDTKLYFDSYINDSIKFIKIVIGLEDEYNIEFDNTDLQLEKYKTIDEFIEMVCQKTNLEVHEVAEI